MAATRLGIDITVNRRVAIKSHWADGKGRRVEGSLRPVVNSVFESVAGLRAERLDRECTARQKDLLAAVERPPAQEPTRAGSEEGDFGRDLSAEAKRYADATVVRRYVRAVRRRLARQADGDAPLEKDEEWVRRATEYADRIDPLVKRFPALARTAPLPPNVLVDALDITGPLRLRLAERGVRDSHGLFEMTRDQVSSYEHELWQEASRTLEICGYPVGDRKTPWGGYF